MAARREKKSFSPLTSFLLLLAAGAALVALLYYRNDLRRLFRMLFVIFLVAGASISCRHIVIQLWRRASLHSRRQQPAETQEPRPDLDEEKQLAAKKAQEQHNKKAEDYESRIGAPRRERKLKEAEEKMRFVRGFRGEGTTVGGAGKGGGGGGGARRRAGHHVTPPEIRVTSPESHLTKDDDDGDDHVTSPDSHVTSTEEDTSQEQGEIITLSLRQPHKVSRKQFKTTDKVQTVYAWAEGLGALSGSDDAVLATSLPRAVLGERAWSLRASGITCDTSLVVEDT